MAILASGTGTRIRSIDVIRGAIMVLMAIDHVRVYSGLPAGGPEPGIFFTRWVTHFCAPVFAFLAGTAAYLHGQKLGDRSKLSRYLVSRGLLLVVLELTVIRFFWTFNLQLNQFMLAGVIWMLGWCMVLLPLFLRLSNRAIGFTGLGIILFQQVFQFVPAVFPASVLREAGYAWSFIYPSILVKPWPAISILYVIVPWIGVMACGYAFGRVVVMEPADRKRICLRTGLVMTALFLVIGCIQVAFQPVSADVSPALFRLLDQNKYPPSQLYLLMTLGPVIALIPFAERAKGWLPDVLSVLGRVPMFYYLAHILLIHLLACGVMLIREGKIDAEWYAHAPFVWLPEGHQWSLGLLYLVFLITIVILYVLCRWFARYKSEHPGRKWLTYI